jgi:glycosyltransferase involved in cell wall biosynthesis
MKIAAHTLVKNEARYVWFSVMSIINYVDKVYLWDTGSTDGTADILKIIKKTQKGKVDLNFVPEVNPLTFTKVRQEMLDKTKEDWLMIIDGDEVWWESAIKRVVSIINNNGQKIDTIVTRYYNLVGDIYHYQSESLGQYKIDNRKGHLNIRAMRRSISGLHVEKPHGLQGYFDESGTLVQNLPKRRRCFLSSYSYLHFTNLPRSTERSGDLRVPKRRSKMKYDMGIPFVPDFYYPEVFFRPRPTVVQSPWKIRSLSYELKSSLAAPMRKVKNLITKDRVGY